MIGDLPGAEGFGAIPFPEIDLTTDEWTFAERAKVMRWHELAHGTGDTRYSQFVPFMIDNNPGGFKRYRALVPALVGDIPRTIFLVHIHAVTGNARGCLYECIAARRLGFSKRQLLDVLNYAFLSSGPGGMNAVADLAGPYLAAWDDAGEDVNGRVPFPDGWAVDPSFFKAGIDPSTAELTAEELERIIAWHARAGDVSPGYELWGRYRGAAFKANRARYEQATSSRVLPAQAYPLMSMHLAATLIAPSAVRHSLNIAKAVGGVTRQQVIDILDLAFILGTEWRMDAVLTPEVVGLIRDWSGPEPPHCPPA